MELVWNVNSKKIVDIHKGEITIKMKNKRDNSNLYLLIINKELLFSILKFISIEINSYLDNIATKLQTKVNMNLIQIENLSYSYSNTKAFGKI